MSAAGNNLEVNMMRTSLLLLAAWLSITVWTACSGGTASDTPAVKAAPAREPQPVAKAPAAVASTLQIGTVQLLPPNPTVSDDLSVVAQVRGAPEGAAVELHYRWFVNKQQLEDAGGDTLSRSFLAKRKWVSCDVQAEAAGQITPWVSSQLVRIANSPPVIQEAPSDESAMPGRFSYQITASDADGDTLTYELISPLDAGITIDAATGLITWDVTEEIVKRLGQNVTVRFLVSDDDGGRVTADLNITLKESR
jgi:hypothetical protein